MAGLAGLTAFWVNQKLSGLWKDTPFVWIKVMVLPILIGGTMGKGCAYLFPKLSKVWTQRQMTDQLSLWINMPLLQPEQALAKIPDTRSILSHPRFIRAIIQWTKCSHPIGVREIYLLKKASTDYLSLVFKLETFVYCNGQTVDPEAEAFLKQENSYIQKTLQAYTPVQLCERWLNIHKQSYAELEMEELQKSTPLVDPSSVTQIKRL
jgi:hypothetical protein